MEGDYTSLAESAIGMSRNIPAPLSWSSLLKGTVIGTSEPSSVSYYAKFDIRFAKRLEGLSWPSHFQGHKSGAAVEVHKSRDVKNESTYVWKGKEFHIALITHKHPAREKVLNYAHDFHVDASDSKRDVATLTSYCSACSFLQIRRSIGHLMLKLCFFRTAC